MVKNGKPAPDLFLHAAAAMGVPPAACVVVEDSPVGVEAAKKAGMRVFGFTGGSHAGRLAAAFEARGPDLVFGAMQALPALLGLEAAPPQARAS